jgi:manganese/zinc/iron transport system permease protein
MQTLALGPVDPPTSADHRSLRDTRLTWPSRSQFLRVIALRDYNTRVVTLGTLLLGLCAGTVGTFMLLRRRSLVGDVVSHASLPGIAIAFLAAELVAPGSGKSLPTLLCGALVAGSLGVLATTAIRKWTRIKEDAALAVVLSVFFGLGIALFTVVQNVPTGNAAGLNHFIFGKAASIVADDVLLIAQASAVVLVLCGLLFKEFALLCFDEEFAAADGWPVVSLDLALMSLVVGVTVIGLQSVGLLLVVAMLIVPAAAARFWTHRLGRMTIASAVIGGMSAYVGVQTSALFPRLAAGAVIVLAGAAFFVVSLLFGTRRGVLWRLLLQWRLRRRVGRQHVLRAMYEALETTLDPGAHLTQDQLVGTSVSFGQLLAMRAWTPGSLEHALASAHRDGLVRSHAGDAYRLTEAGAAEAGRIVRNHRLWELYLLKYADVAPAQVDREADAIEHVLDPELVAELEQLMSKRYRKSAVPPSPHQIEVSAGAGT